jgi:hypothetical protein
MARREGMRTTVTVVERTAEKAWRRMVAMYGQGLAEARLGL